MPLVATCVQLEGLFFSQLLLEIQKVNAYSLGRADQIGERLEQLAPLLSKGELIGALSGKLPPEAPRETLNRLTASPLLSQETRQSISLFMSLADEVSSTTSLGATPPTVPAAACC
jgi:hypothetical protein